MIIYDASKNVVVSGLKKSSRRNSTTKRLALSLLLPVNFLFFLALIALHQVQENTTVKSRYSTRTIPILPGGPTTKYYQDSNNRHDALRKLLRRNADQDSKSEQKKIQDEAKSTAQANRNVLAPKKKINKDNLVLDIMSVGSNTRKQYLKAQQETFGSHGAVRNFFAITEDDDIEKNCSTQLSPEEASQITEFCLNEERTKAVAYDHPILAKMRPYFNEHYPDSGGWICAQKRPIDALSKTMNFYERNPQSLPDYLMIIDDDTYLSLPDIHDYLQKTRQATDNIIMAGCLDRWDDTIGQPWGGWGTFVSKGALINLMRQIDCDASDQDAFTLASCNQVHQDLFGEKRVFRNGMNILELMQAYVSADKFADFKKWSDQGFCVQSDWIWGYFFNFYPVSDPEEVPVYIDGQRQRHRMQSYQDPKTSDYLDVRRSEFGQKLSGQCEYDSADTCDGGSHICHYMSPAAMYGLARNEKQRDLADFSNELEQNEGNGKGSKLDYRNYRKSSYRNYRGKGKGGKSNYRNYRGKGKGKGGKSNYRNYRTYRLPYTTEKKGKASPKTDDHQPQILKNSVRRIETVANTTLIVLWGNVRGGEPSWQTMYRHLLDHNNADLALMVGMESASTSSLYRKAKYIWQFNEPDDWGNAIDQIFGLSSTDAISWRELGKQNMNGPFGGTTEDPLSSGAIRGLVHMWIAEKIQSLALLEKYERFVITRTDQYYTTDVDLLSLDPMKIWVPQGEDWGGICDRFYVSGKDHILQALNTHPPAIRKPEKYYSFRGNIESFVRLRWEEDGLFDIVRRFPRSMFSAAVEQDSSRWGVRKPAFVEDGVSIGYKYIDEYYNAMSSRLWNSAAVVAKEMQTRSAQPFIIVIYASSSNVEMLESWLCNTLTMANIHSNTLIIAASRAIDDRLSRLNTEAVILLDYLPNLFLEPFDMGTRGYLRMELHKFRIIEKLLDREVSLLHFEPQSDLWLRNVYDYKDLATQNNNEIAVLGDGKAIEFVQLDGRNLISRQLWGDIMRQFEGEYVLTPLLWEGQEDLHEATVGANAMAFLQEQLRATQDSGLIVLKLVSACEYPSLAQSGVVATDVICADGSVPFMLPASIVEDAFAGSIEPFVDSTSEIRRCVNEIKAIEILQKAKDMSQEMLPHPRGTPDNLGETTKYEVQKSTSNITSPDVAFSDTNLYDARAHFVSLNESEPFLVGRLTEPSCRSLMPNEIDFTLAIQVSMHRLSMMEHQCRIWGQSRQISIAVYTDHTKDLIQEKLESLGCRKETTVVQVLNPSIFPTDVYPVNKLRNIAMSGVLTSHAVYVDVETLLSRNIYAHLSSQRFHLNHSKAVLVLPTFEYQPKCRKNGTSCFDEDLSDVPLTKPELLAVWSPEEYEQQIVQPFYADFRLGQSSTPFRQWKDQAASDHLPVSCIETDDYGLTHWEPFFVAQVCNGFPLAQESFMRYGFEKSSWIREMVQRGYTFSVLGEGFVLHLPHPHSKAKENFYRSEDIIGQEFERYLSFDNWLNSHVQGDQEKMKKVHVQQDDQFCYDLENKSGVGVLEELGE